MSGETALTIIRRLIDHGQRSLSPGAAQAVLGLKFTQPDYERMTELAAMSSQGNLSPEEGNEFDGYVAVADVLSLWKSKARLSLKTHTSAASGDHRADSI